MGREQTNDRAERSQTVLRRFERLSITQRMLVTASLSLAVTFLPALIGWFAISNKTNSENPLPLLGGGAVFLVLGGWFAVFSRSYNRLTQVFLIPIGTAAAYLGGYGFISGSLAGLIHAHPDLLWTWTIAMALLLVVLIGGQLWLMAIVNYLRKNLQVRARSNPAKLELRGRQLALMPHAIIPVGLYTCLMFYVATLI